MKYVILVCYLYYVYRTYFIYTYIHTHTDRTNVQAVNYASVPSNMYLVNIYKTFAGVM